MKMFIFAIIFGFLLSAMVEGFLHHPLHMGLDRNNFSYAELVSGIISEKCNFEEGCAWQWSENSFSNSTSEYLRKTVPSEKYIPYTDADGVETGHFLYAFDANERRKEMNLTSPPINPAYFDQSHYQMCTLSFALNSNLVPFSNISVLIQEGKRTKVIENRINSDVVGFWQIKKVIIGHPEDTFRIIIEIGATSMKPSYVAIDNIELSNCYPEVTFDTDCPPDRKFRCVADGICIPLDMVCDIRRDCSDSMDEKQNCGEVPAETRCTFESGWCGWHNATDKQHALLWKLNQGHTRSFNTGPSQDNTFSNLTGTYAYVDMSSGTLGSLALMESAEINPPPQVHGDPHSPHYNSCHITFFYHKYGPHSGSLGLYLKEMKMGTYKNAQRLWWSYGNKGDLWLRQVVVLPNITDRYRVQFEARKSMSSRGDVAIDDISFSPKCFGKGIPKDDLGDYDYYEYPKKYSGSMNTHTDFENHTMYVFTTCGVLGPEGPTAEDCQYAYANTSTQVTVLETANLRGIQKWIVPDTSYYTIIAKGARGGKGADALGESKATIATVVTELYKDQAIYILVGQEGQDACKKLSFDTPACLIDLHFRTKGSFKSHFQEYKLEDGGGGGGGATFVFTMERGHEPSAIVVAAGGGGLAHGPFLDDGRQHGNGVNTSLPNITAPAIGLHPAGAGGGWKPGNLSGGNSTGSALMLGGRGGPPCYETSDRMKGAGGFGGGGGGCVAGGGGGGYTGGRSWSDSHINGEGGWSMFLDDGQFKSIQTGMHYGAGSVLIIPAVIGCGCEYRCVALDELRSITKCICSPGWELKSDNHSCSLAGVTPSSIGALWFSVGSLLAFCIILIIIFFILYNRYMQQKTELTKRKICSSGISSHAMNGGPHSVRLTELNPNYEFGGVTYTIRDLREIPRERIQLVKPLGCGAFGDVYQGLLRQRSTDSVDLAVAVKILPALCSSQAENDFLMEALIMSKFNHPNIVHFIGACFDTHPRYIILELLAGGDLKNFLRENRPKADKPSTLTMRDLIQCAIDVAKGCLYLEELHFIHRDIAARNCLLTTRGPGRVVKIADFGMSRDIYRSDYYKKGGKTMLPIKWMPPEAFLDGIFSTKTDVWSFGVLLWEVMSLGFMPFTAICNREVMTYVARGARLGAPANCPPQVFAIMGMCWHQDATQRPGFATILERLGYCLQDPTVINGKLPEYTGPLPSELDKTIMRLPTSDDYFQADYMIPIMPDTPVEGNDGATDVANRYLPDGLFSNSSCMRRLGRDNTDSGSVDYITITPDGTNFEAPDRSNTAAPFTLSGQFVQDPKV